MQFIIQCYQQDTYYKKINNMKVVRYSAPRVYLLYFRDWSIFNGGFGPVQKSIGQILYFAKIIIELELFSTSARVG